MKKLLLILITSLNLISCGYHLRGTIALAPPLHNLYLKTPDPYGQLARNLSQILKASGVHLADTPATATSILTIEREETAQHLVSISGTQQTRQYNLVLTVYYKISNAHDVTLVNSRKVSETRILTIKADQILGGSNEANNLYQQMRQNIVYDIISELASQNTTALLTKVNP